MPNTSNDDVIIVGSLSDKELRESIDKLVDYVGDKTTIMAGKFDVAMEKMKSAMKDFAITQKVSVDLMQDAWKQMSASFDAMLKAQQNATSSGNNSGSGGGNSQYADNTVGHLQEIIALEEKRRKEMTLGSDALRDQNKLIEEQKAKLKGETTSDQVKAAQAAKKELQEAFTMPARGLADAEKKLQQLQSLSAKFQGRGILDQTQWNRLNAQIQTTQEKIDKLRQKKPTSIQDVLGMDESSVDAIAKKMAALKKVTVDPQNTAQVKQLGDEYQRLKRLQAELMGQNIQMTHSNNYLAQSFGYIRNRLVYAMTLGEITSFTKQVYEIRGQYELLERSLGVLVNSFEKGSQIFQELNEMAIKSPFTLIELGTAAKQLTAYNFAADEVVDTTRRLADISAALGVPMERLTYNLGQIKAQGVLNARDARDFANAGLAIVPMLAQMYTEQKRFGDQVVTTAQVYDMMSKKLVSYSDVLQVLYKITDEGGKFFDFQAKQADTLRVQLANLTLAYNNMLNEIGAEHQSTLSKPIHVIKELFQNWREVNRVLLTLITTFGVYKTVSMLAVGSQTISAWISLAKSIKSAKDAMALFNLTTSANPLGLLLSLLAAVVGYFVLFKNKVSEVSKEVEMFGESATKTLKKIDTFKKILEGTSETSSTYKKTLSELSSITDEYGVQLDKENAKRSDVNSAIEQTIELIKTESAERQRANQLAKAQETYDTQSENAKKELRERLKSAMTGTNLGLFTWKSNSKELQENADAIADIVGSIVESNITLIAGKTGKEYEKGLDKIFSLIQDRMKAIGISESTVSKQWLSSALFSDTNIINEYIDKINNAKNAQDAYTNKIEQNYLIAKKATDATMSFTEKVDANARALRNNANDAVSLYNKIYDIVKIAQQNHVINFDLKLTAQKPPQWMLNMDLPELQRLAARFTAIAQSGGHAGGYTQETTYERGLMYASAARQKQYEEERKALEERNKANNKTKKTGGTKKDPLADSLKEEIELIDNIQKRYNEYRKIGVSTQEAIAKAAEEYNATLTRVNATLNKYGIQTKNANELANMDLRGVRDYYKSLLDVAKGANNTKGIESLEKAIAKINVEITKADYKKITDGLNSELGKIKDEYELAVELDANPELGGIFADMMGLNKEQLSQMPKDFDGVVERLQKIIDNKLGAGKFNLIKNLNKASFDAWLEANKQGKPTDDALAKSLESIIDYANKVRLDSSKKQIEEWNKLLEKYAEYEYKVTQIQKGAERERETARKKGASQEILDSINNWEKQELARVSFEEFQKYPEWIVATGDLANMSKSAIGMLIEQLEKYKRSAKNLSPKQIKQLNSALSKLYKEQRKNNPFKAISNMLDEAKEHMATFDEDIKKTQEEIDNLTKKKKESIVEGIADEETDNKLKKAINRLKELKKEQEKTGKVDASSWVSSINETIGAVQSAIGVFNDLAKAIGGVDSSDLDKVFSVIDKAGQGAAVGAQIGGGYGAIIGAAAGLLSGIVTTFADAWSGNAYITEQVEDSVLAVKRLENSYKNLEKAVEEAFGASEIAAKKAEIANKKLQLAELQRQLQLERSRDSKKRDAGKIADLEGQIIDLKNELKDMRNDITNSFLGISSVSDAVSSMMDDIVDALRNGEDAMQGFNDSIDDMIANMIKQVFSARILGPMIEKILKNIDDEIQARGEVPADQLARFKSMYDNIVTNTGDTGNGYWFYRQGNTWGYTNSWVQAHQLKMQEGVEMMTYGAWKSAIENILSNTQEWLDDETTPTMNDIRRYAGDLREVSPELEAYMDDLEAILREMGLIKDATSEEALSKLQQGLQGVSEETAGAVEAYLNGMSQQAYLRNDLLTQIRDTIMSFDVDVQLGVFSQMLLQLQNNYIVMQSMQSMMEGWTTPSGQGIRVELLS